MSKFLCFFCLFINWYSVNSQKIAEVRFNLEEYRTSYEYQFYDDRKFFIGMQHESIDSLHPHFFSGIYEVNDDTIHFFSKDIYIIDSVNVNYMYDSKLKNTEFQLIVSTKVYFGGFEVDYFYWAPSVVLDDSCSFILDGIEYRPQSVDRKKGITSLIANKKNHLNPVEVINDCLPSEIPRKFYFIYEFNNTMKIDYFYKIGMSNSRFNYCESNRLHFPVSLTLNGKKYFLKYYYNGEVCRD